MQKTINFERHTIWFNKREWSAVKAAKAATKANHLNLVRHDAVTVKQLDRNSKLYKATAKKPKA